jgi:hypothetical protein
MANDDLNADHQALKAQIATQLIGLGCVMAIM